jgi:hypothetical protein
MQTEKCKVQNSKLGFMVSFHFAIFNLHFLSAYAGDHGLGRGGMRSSGWGLSGDAVGLLRQISLPGG